MAQTPEGRVKLAIKNYLNAIGAWWCMPATGGYGRSGIPDFLVCWRGGFYGIEAKAPGSRSNTTVMQRNELAAIAAASGCAVVVEDVSELVTLFDDGTKLAEILK